jgi:hypothetical protein
MADQGLTIRKNPEGKITAALNRLAPPNSDSISIRVDKWRILKAPQFLE